MPKPCPKTKRREVFREASVADDEQQRPDSAFEVNTRTCAIAVLRANSSSQRWLKESRPRDGAPLAIGDDP